MAEAAHELLGGVDILVHNAGGAQPFAGSTAIPDDGWQNALDLNLLAAVRLDAPLTPGMREQASGSIVHISSAAVPAAVGPFLHYSGDRRDRGVAAPALLDRNG